jgi:erythritol/L-threitol dehydrogenase
MSTDTTVAGTMRAVVCHGIKDYRQSVVPVPSPEPGEVLIKVARCGLCAGDAKCFHGADMFWSDSYLGPGGAPYVETPCIPGHEFCGTVVRLGAGACGPRRRRRPPQCACVSRSR